MTYHLTPDERVDALDGVLAAARRDHLTACPRCQQELVELQDVANTLQHAGPDDVPEPSPMFWTHMERRVAAAVDTAEKVRPMAWWQGSTRAWGALAAAAVLVLAVGAQTWWANRAMTDNSVYVDTGVAADTVADSVQWDFVVNVLDTLEPDDVRAVLGPPSRGALDAAFESLTAAERDAFARLLQAELAEGSN
ncbi:MAG: hypothetical protein O2917_10735 [Acidobacteria bacterium]|nr:hypothetical protein [Acidobacteriota bacterium]